MSIKKLQVFVSSTFTDLQQARQAAVQAILSSGHIPAGMELFAAGDEGQMQVIKRWIDESDVYLLILGARYGSIEPVTQKSYVQLEYEYALLCRKPLFAVVLDSEYLDEYVREHGIAVLELQYAARLADFRSLVQSKIVRFWRDPRDIKLAIMETLSEFARRPELVGWVRGDTADTAAVADEIARLSRENASLRHELSEATAIRDTARYSGLTFSQMRNLLLTTTIERPFVGYHDLPFAEVVSCLGGDRAALLHIFWLFTDVFRRGLSVSVHSAPYEAANMLREFGLVRLLRNSLMSYYYELSDVGHQFIMRLRVECDTRAIEKLRVTELSS